MRLFLATVVFCFSCAVFAQTNVYSDARSLVQRVQDDLKRSADFAHKKGKEKERYDNAQKHLSEFDRHLDKGKFDKDKLDGAIDDVKNVLDHNTLSPDQRDALQSDIQQLRDLRERRGR